MALNAFKRLDPDLQHALIMRVAFRKRRFLAMQAGQWVPKGQLLLIGDRPAPSAPNDPNFHYTPFGALENCSLWLNIQLERAGVPEDQLGWLNAADFNGNDTDSRYLDLPWGRRICLGANASKWAKGAGIDVLQVHHPQAWKRFHARDPYPLIKFLQPKQM
jgi:hypothetical protein